MSEQDQIRVQGAAENNLKAIDVEIPRGSFSVVTGISGSGKSSLAFDVLFQEGQRHFLNSLSAYARQFLGGMERPEVEKVEGLTPTVCIDQKTVSRNPRSTVGTVTEILDHLRLLMARLGVPHCPACGEAITSLSPGQIVDHLLRSSLDAPVQILAPVVRARKGSYRKDLEGWLADGWIRARIDGEVRSLEEDIELARYEQHTIELVIDRLRLTHESRDRLIEGVESALQLTEGVVTTLVGEEHQTWSSFRSCSQHPEVSIPELEPRFFSFNAHQGQCADCQGLGVREAFDLDRIIDPEATLPEALRPFRDYERIPFTSLDREAFVDVCRALGVKRRSRWSQLSEAQRRGILFGEGEPLVYLAGGRRRSWRGLIPLMQEVWHYTSYRGFKIYRRSQSCPTCQGERLNPIARAVRFQERTLPQLCQETIRSACDFFDGVTLEGQQRLIGGELLEEIRERLGFLRDVGLGYLELDRTASTLSGGESQRIRLAAQIGSGLQGVTYVLDEPSIGLHPRDNVLLIDTLKRLRDKGNTLLVVEHDRETWAAADYLVEVGPGAGREGGRVTGAGHLGQFLRSEALSAQYLRGERSVPRPEPRPPAEQHLLIRGASANNLRGVDVQLPLQRLVCLAGVSGSGKSSLMMEVILSSWQQRKNGEGPVLCQDIEGWEQLENLVVVDQSPIGRTPRSNPATYTQVWGPIRELFASLPLSKERGYKPGRFSFNVKGGRCEHCQGAGVRLVEMQVLADVMVTCEVCEGMRFNPETLEVCFQGRHIKEVLDLTVAEALQFFANQPKIRRILEILNSVGLGYIQLGQPSTTISGGEAQRIKLTRELRKRSGDGRLYLLDEPTTGLHPHDIEALLGALGTLVDAGHSVVVIEHNSDVLMACDHIIELGPEGGAGGGLIVAEGSPAELAALDTATGLALARELSAEPLKPGRRPKPIKPRAHQISLRGASCHNLKAIDIDLPQTGLISVTGPSGSGKSSLAFHTLFQEGQRRYIEALSTYARRFLSRVGRPPLASAEGLAPAIAIDQKRASHNPRSTVSTVTEIYDYLRVLWSRAGQVHCPTCQEAVEGWSASRVAHSLKIEGAGPGWILARLPRHEHPKETREGLLREGFLRLLDGRDQVHLEDQPERAEALLRARAMLVIDRVRPEREATQRLAEAFQEAYRRGEGLAHFLPRREGPLQSYSQAATCIDHGSPFPKGMEPRDFSWNTRQGACPDCEGLGVREDLDPDRVIPYREYALMQALDGRIATVLRRGRRARHRIRRAMDALKIPHTRPVSLWSKQQLDGMLHGLPEEVLRFKVKASRYRKRQAGYERWEGLFGILNGWNSRLEWLRTSQLCRSCEGSRLQPAARSVRLGGVTLPEFCALSVGDALERVQALELSPSAAAIAEQPLREVQGRLRFMAEVGLTYLSLDRSARTLSGGESQRLRLATQLGAGLTGCLYVLDEPTIGLHPRDTERLLGTLEALRDLGNCVLTVEHDLQTIERSDWVVDLGPASGEDGGRIVAQGTPEQIREHPRSLTGAYLSGRERIPLPKRRRKPKGFVEVQGAQLHNLKSLDLKVPLGGLVVFTGVSGAGKSTLLMDTLVPGIQSALGGDIAAPCPVLVPEEVSAINVVDQTPISRSPRSTPATFTKAMDPIRKLFASMNEAIARGYGAGRFSYNGRAGRCPVCEGKGVISLEMHFLSDINIPCESCGGKRFNEATLQIQFRGHSIAEVLQLRISEARDLFENQKAIHKRLDALCAVGLGYMRLGQATSELSGGENQRLKLAAGFIGRRKGRIFALDEPTTGLHMSDVSQLLSVLQELVAKGATVWTIEHHPDLIAAADWVIDLGPDGGPAGGEILAEGPPELLVERGTPTGVAIAPLLSS